MKEKVKEYILSNWKNTIKEVHQEPVRGDDLLALPYPFTSPSEKGRNYFQMMFYWDTYFINVGLLRSDLLQQAINNCENVSYIIEKYGYFPNGSTKYFLRVRTQIPFFAFMVRDIYEYTHDDEWLRSKYAVIKKEYDWWQEKRTTNMGLNRYGDHGMTIDEYKQNGIHATRRLRIENTFKGDLVKFGQAHCAVCESGWDSSPRFDDTCMYACPIDLNCNLYFYEIFLDKIQKKFAIDDRVDWTEKAAKRKELINKYLWNEEKQMYMDYNFVEEKQYDTLSAAALHPYYVGLADEDKLQGLENCYKLFMKKYGLACTDRDYGFFQWSYPNGWAPLHCIAFDALNNYGKREYADEVAEKYMQLCERVYKEKSLLSEKFNVIEGNDNTVDEDTEHYYMLGWTAGVYMYFYSKYKK